MKFRASYHKYIHIVTVIYSSAIAVQHNLTQLLFLLHVYTQHMQELFHLDLLLLVKELAPFCWTMCSALGQRPHCSPVPAMELVTMHVTILKMLGSGA